MKTKIKFLVYPLAVILISMFIIIGCSDDDPEPDPINPPTLTTLAVTDITETSAKSGGSITDDGGGEITARGVIWSTDVNPSLDDHIGMKHDGTGTGEFHSAITDLSPETTYYIRAYATNSAGTSYGNDVMFETLSDEDDDNGDDDNVIYGDGVTDIDGNEYITVIIGELEWMAENLKVTKYNNDDDIPNHADDSDWESPTGAYCWYDNNEEVYSATYGALYNYYAVSSGNLCPTGWRVPSDDEWMELEGTVDSQYGVGNPEWNEIGWRGYDAGIKLKAISGWNSSNSGAGVDEFGFSALPGGFRYNSGLFFGISDYGGWWSNTEFNETNAWRRRMLWVTENVLRNNHNKGYGLSVRCVKD